MTAPSTATAEVAELQLSVLPDETLVWQKGPVVGSGRFGQVFLALRLPSAELLAVKQVFIQEELDQGHDGSSLSLQRTQTLAQIEREAAVLRLLQRHQHPNVVRVIGSERYGPTWNIFMEYLPAGSLSKLLKEFGALEESMLCVYLRDVVSGVAHLHALGLAHRDLKCANLLLANDERGGVKITDFGTAKLANLHTDENVEPIDKSTSKEDGGNVETARSVREGLGSPFWMAPELVRAEKGPDSWQKADIWGIGCVAIEMATGKPPWDSLSNPLTVMFHIASPTTTPALPTHFSATAQAFLARCFDKNPATRASAEELLRHSFLSEEEQDDDVLPGEEATIEEVSSPTPAGDSSLKPGDRFDVSHDNKQGGRSDGDLHFYLVQWEQLVRERCGQQLWFQILSRWVARARRTLARSRLANQLPTVESNPTLDLATDSKVQIATSLEASTSRGSWSSARFQASTHSSARWSSSDGSSHEEQDNRSEEEDSALASVYSSGGEEDNMSGTVLGTHGTACETSTPHR